MCGRECIVVRVRFCLWRVRFKFFFFLFSRPAGPSAVVALRGGLRGSLRGGPQGGPQGRPQGRRSEEILRGDSQGKFSGETLRGGPEGRPLKFKIRILKSKFRAAGLFLSAVGGVGRRDPQGRPQGRPSGEALRKKSSGGILKGGPQGRP